MDQPAPSSRSPLGVPRVVIVGAGFGGLEAAKALAQAPIHLTVIDKQNHHCFQPLLYQVATAALSPADVAWPIRSVLRDQRNAEVLMAEVTGIDPHARLVHTDAIPIPYDYLVLATGATHSYFGKDEWAEFAPGLKRIEDATDIRRRILIAFERAELTDDEQESRRLLTFVIVGGGPTGVELAGAIAEVARQTLAQDFRNIDPTTSRIFLVEAGPRILAAFSEDLATYAAQSLERMGVSVLTNARVTACDSKGVALGDARIEAATLMWAAGVMASEAADWIGAKSDRARRIIVSEDLTVPGHDNIFAIGDTAAVAHESGRTVPGIAPAAKQMGHHVARVILAAVAGSKRSSPFRYKHQGDLATIGHRSAIVQLPRMKLTGLSGWLFWSIAHIYFLIGVRNRLIVAVNWVANYLTYRRGARLITLDGVRRRPTSMTSRHSDRIRDQFRAS
jgi:NADH dehydrogenase